MGRGAWGGKTGARRSLGANHVSRAPESWWPLPLLVISGLVTGPRQGWATGFDSSQGAANTSVRARGVLSVGIPRFLNKSQHFTVHLFSPKIPSSTRWRHFLSSFG